MLAKLENGSLKVARGKVLKERIEEKIMVPEVSINEETQEEEIIYTEQIIEKEIAVANPREEDWIAAGYKELEEGERLEEREGFYQVPVYTEEENKIVLTYEYREATEYDI